jgi:hypothetical protein
MAWLPSGSQTEKPVSGPATTRSRPAVPGGSPPGVDVGRPTCSTQPATIGLVPIVPYGSRAVSPTKHGRSATVTGRASSSDLTVLSGSAVISRS